LTRWMNISKKRLAVVLVILVSLLTMVMLSGCAGGKTMRALKSLERTTSRLNSTKDKENDKKEDTQTHSLSPIKDVLKAHHINFTVLAASAQNTKGFLAVVQNKEKYYICIYSGQDNKIAWTDYTAKTVNFKENYSIYSNGTKSYHPLIFIMDIPNDNKESQDKDLGIWNDTHHHMPVYVTFEVDNKGTVYPEGKGKLFSGLGLKPSHYQGPIQDPQNINLGYVLITQMDSLKQDIKARNVISPG